MRVRVRAFPQFIVFEFPTTSEELLGDLLAALAVNGITQRALTCLVKPSFKQLPEVWTVLIVLVAMLIISLSNAVRRDRAEIRFIEGLLKGKRKDARSRLVRLIRLGNAQARSRGFDDAQPRGLKNFKLMRSLKVLSGRGLLRRSRKSVVPTVAPTLSPASAHTAEAACHGEGREASIAGTSVPTDASTAACSSSVQTDGVAVEAFQANVVNALATYTRERVPAEAPTTAGPNTSRAAARWRQAKVSVRHQVLVNRWHKDVDRVHKRLWISFKSSHTLMAGVIFKGYAGHTRAETIMILMNSLALEVVVLCMFYSMPSEGPLVINPIKIAINGALCAFICIPAMLVFAWLFQPQTFVQFFIWLLRCLFCWPLALRACCQRRSKRVAPAAEASHPVSPPASPPAPGEDVAEAWVTPRPRPGTETEAEKSIERSVIKRLARQVTQFATAQPERHYSYASLNEYFIRQSLSKSFKNRDCKSTTRILVAWLLSLICFFGMLLVFALYGCEIYFFATEANSTGTELLLSWAWSILQRFVVNEPLLILVGKLVPMLFSTALCANVCGESIANLAGYLVAGIISFVKVVTRR